MKSLLKSVVKFVLINRPEVLEVFALMLEGALELEEALAIAAEDLRTNGTPALLFKHGAYTLHVDRKPLTQKQLKALANYQTTIENNNKFLLEIAS